MARLLRGQGSGLDPQGLGQRMSRARPAGAQGPLSELSVVRSEMLAEFGARRLQALFRPHPSRPQVVAGSAGARNLCSKAFMQAMLPQRGCSRGSLRGEGRGASVVPKTGCLPEAFLPSALESHF